MRLVRQIFGREPSLAVHPEESVAMGAAIQAGIAYGEVKDLVLLDVAPFTLGIETKDGTFTPIIDRNSTIPTRKSRVFTTVADNQRRIEIHVLQGESDMARYNTSLAKFELTGIPPAPQGKPQIEIGFEIDVNGIVSVEAEGIGPETAAYMSPELARRAIEGALHLVVHPSGGLSRADVNRLVSETGKCESEEKSRKEHEAVVRQLDGLVANTMRSVQVLEAKLTADEQKRILDSIERAKKAHGDGTLEAVKALLAEMETAAGIIGQAMLRTGSA